ncbi:hypothetical protein QQX98_010518 [Neonectria punicea]|uniref:Uncharacterized protein n=1 Tax=Neonectria punicea TaxID=979145 RepID=A0ABR1GPP5_9HYPO
MASASSADRSMRRRRADVEVLSNQPETVQKEEPWPAWVKGLLKWCIRGMQTWANDMLNRLLEEEKKADEALPLAVSPGDTTTKANDRKAAKTRLPPVATAVGQLSRQDQQPLVSLSSLEPRQPSQLADQTNHDDQIAPDWYRWYREQHKQHWRQMHPLGADYRGVAITTEWYTWYRMEHRRLQALKREKASQGGDVM